MATSTEAFEPPVPLAVGSISFRAYPHDLPPREVVREVAAQSALAEAGGFDGVMTQEHHGGFPNYLPNPLLAATWILEATDRIWAAPCPTLLPLRPWTQLVEDLAWTSHRFPGRVGAGVGSGAFPLDFEMAGVPFEEMRDRYWAALPDVAAALAGAARGPVGDDPGVAALADSPIPLVTAAQGPLATTRAARMGLGVIFNSLQTHERTRELSELHAAHAPAGARILIRRVWIGAPPEEAVAAQLARYRAVGSADLQAHWAPDGGLVTAETGAEVVDRLADALAATGCDALNLRVFQAGMAPAQVRGQLELLGADVLPALRTRMAALAPI